MRVPKSVDRSSLKAAASPTLRFPLDKSSTPRSSSERLTEVRYNVSAICSSSQNCTARAPSGFIGSDTTFVSRTITRTERPAAGFHHGQRRDRHHQSAARKPRVPTRSWFGPLVALPPQGSSEPPLPCYGRVVP